MEPLDIWRSAQLMVKQHGLFAPQECRNRADRQAASGDKDGELAWEAIRRAAESLLENGSPRSVRAVWRAWRGPASKSITGIPRSRT
jgi:hypothetical protein